MAATWSSRNFVYRRRKSRNRRTMELKALWACHKGQGVQAIYGLKADVLKSDIQDVSSGEGLKHFIQQHIAQKLKQPLKGYN